MRPGELLYSAVARFHRKLAQPSHVGVLQALIGSRRGIATFELPGSLDDIARSLLMGERRPFGSGVSLLEGHTLFPYFSTFQPLKRAEIARASLLTGGGQHAHGRLGIRSSSVPLTVELRYCRTCVEADRRAYGIPHWHRAHQAPGVEVCHLHAEPLVLSGVRRHRRSRLAFCSLEQAICESDDKACDRASEASVRLASDSAHLMSLSNDGCRLEDLRQAHVRALAAAGLATHSRPNLSEIRDQLKARWGEGWLARFGCRLQPGNDWLARMLQRPRAAAQPLQHLVLIQLHSPRTERFLKAVESAGSVTEQRAPRPSAPTHLRGEDWEERLPMLVNDGSRSLRQIAREMGVDARTVQRRARSIGVWRDAWSTWSQSARATKRTSMQAATRHKHRTIWTELAREGPASSLQVLRQAAPTTYSYLHRYDRAWLQAMSPPRQARGPSRARIDWKVRDLKLAEEADRAADSLLDLPGRPVRLTRTAIARQLGHGALILEHGSRLPTTTARIEARVESRLDFARRRIRWAALNDLAAQRSRTTLSRRAGLRPDLADDLVQDLDHYTVAQF